MNTHIQLIVEVDVGQQRCGVSTEAEVLSLAEYIGGKDFVRVSMRGIQW